MFRCFIFDQEPNDGHPVRVPRGARLDFLDLFRFAFAFYFAEFWRGGRLKNYPAHLFGAILRMKLVRERRRALKCVLEI